MWTGLGVIFIIILLAIPICKWIGILLFGSASAASERGITRRKMEEANAEKLKQEQLDKVQYMTQDFRQYKLSENPDTVVVGEKIEINSVWKDGQGWVFPHTVEKHWYYLKSDIKPYNHNIKHIPENGYTDSLYEYIEKVDFLDDHEKTEWSRHNYCNWNSDSYGLVRENQCRQYCEAISMLVHRYVNFGDNTELRDEFIKLLMQDRELTLKFIRECHAANKWKEQYNQVYDCKNYLQDFLIENKIRDKLNEQAGHEVTVPDDIRPFRDKTSDKTAAKHIRHELDKRERVGKAEESEYKAQGWWGGVAVMTVICVVLILVFFFGTDHHSEQATQIMLTLIGISILLWIIVTLPAVGHQNDADKVKEEERGEEYYMSSFPREANAKGKEYAKTLLKEILSHPTPYKYYEKQ